MAAESAELKILNRGALLGALLVLAACVPPDFGVPEPSQRTPVPAPSAPPAVAVIRPVPAPPPVAPGRVETQPPPIRTAPPVGSASQALLRQSRGYQASGDYGLAAASIERALRIEPRQPVLWLELGNIRLKEADYAQAENMGRKALSLSTGDAALSAEAEQLIAAARKR
jgi:tetratricopeptide (TPR) repeat protein